MVEGVQANNQTDFAMTECNQQLFEFQVHSSHKVTADFSGGYLSSDGGALFLRGIDLKLGLIDRLAGCFVDLRHRAFVEHQVAEVLRQRIGALALGYEDLNDHDRLRLDPLHALMAGKKDIEGLDRLCEEAIRKRFGKKVRIIVRGDSGFAREEIFAWCEEHGVYYCMGLARNERLQGHLEAGFEALRQQIEAGEMENRIKEAQQDLFADRTSTGWMASNQLRLWFSAFAHLMLSVLRAEVLRGTEPADATLGTIRLRLLKIAARIKVSCRRIHFELAGGYPYRELFAQAHRQLGMLQASG